ncbi:MAG: hypothetical protein JRJ41_13220, partial [Deltaproteobacteria bacterium]|nr:hypothetical protein [Deltaproteobacteria bacterium]
MKTSRSSGAFRPFKDLKNRLKKKSFSLPPLDVNSNRPHLTTGGRRHNTSKTDCHDVNQVKEDEKKMFLEAMADVKPIQRGDRVETYSTTSLSIDNEGKSDDEALQSLQQLVEFGKGFVVSDTPEYIEGTGYNINPEFAKRLHRGDFSIQAHIDLHGLCVED